VQDCGNGCGDEVEMLGYRRGPEKTEDKQRNLSLTNLKGPKILFFIAGALLLQGLFTIELTTEGLEI
jgi:hypothetical protein